MTRRKPAPDMSTPAVIRVTEDTNSFVDSHGAERVLRVRSAGRLPLPGRPAHEASQRAEAVRRRGDRGHRDRRRSVIKDRGLW